MKTSKLLITSLLAAAAMGTSAYAGFVWNGGETITQELWQTEDSWTLTDSTTWPTSGTGPLTPTSDAWDGATVANASGAVNTLEGWTLRLTLQNANLTVTNLKKLQGGCTLNLDAGSVLTVNNFSGANDGGSTTLNVEGVFNLAYNKNQGGDGFIANLGNSGVLNFTAYNTPTRTAKVSRLNATLNTTDFDSYTIDANGNTVYTRNLIRLGDNVSFDTNTTTTVTMTPGAGVGTLTRVEEGDISGTAAGSYKVTKGPSGYSVSYVVAGTTYAWNATAADSVWNTSAENWTTNGGSTSVAFTERGNVFFGSGDTLAKTVAINSAVTAGTISVADDYTFNVGASGSLSATAVAVAGTKTATLNLASNMALSANLGGSGTLKKTGASALTYSGTISSGATLEIAEGGTISVGANGAGTLTGANVFSGTLNNGGTLNISGGVTNVTSNQTLNGNVVIASGATLYSATTDAVTWGAPAASQILSVLGTLHLDARWSMGSGKKIVLAGGSITGTGGENAGATVSLDYYESGTIAVEAGTTGSQISASIRTKNTLTFDAAADLVVSGDIVKRNDTDAAKIVKAGAGTLTLSGTNTYRSLEVSAGKLVAASAGALGSGAVTVDGDGSILDINLSSGTLTQGASQALTTTNGGKITVSAGTLALAGAVNLSSKIEVASGASVTTTGDVSFALAGLTGTSNEDGSTTFTLFTLENGASLTWNHLTAANLNLVGSSLAVRDATATFDNAAGTVTVSSTAGELTWVGGEAANGITGTWNYVANNKPWTMSGVDTAFLYNDNVTFSKDATVAVDAGGVTAGTVTIASGTVEFRSGKVTAQDKFIVESGATLKLSPVSTTTDSGAYVAGEVEVRSDGTLDMNGAGGASYGGLTTVTLAGGKLTNTGAIKGTSARQFDSIVLTANSSVVADSGKDFGLVKSGHGATTLDLGAHTLTKSGAGSFVLVNTTISGNGGVLDVTEGKILGLTDDNKNIALGEGVTLKTSGTGGAENIKITSMGANSKLILGGSAASTVAIAGAVGGNSADATISISNGNSVSYSGGSLKANVTVTGSGSRFTQSTNNGADQLGYTTTVERTFEISNGGTLDLGSNRWTIQKKNLFTLDGGTITGTYQTTDSATYGSLDFDGGDNKLTVNQTHGLASTIESSIRIRGNDVIFEVNDGATLNITGKIGNSKTNNNTVTTTGKLVKAGSGTMTLDLRSLGTSWQNETFTGLKIDGGCVVVKNAAVFDAGTTTVEVKEDALLTIAADGVNTGAVTFAAGSKFALDLTNMTVVEDRALTIIASSAISFNSTPTGSLTSDIIESYFDAGNSVLGDYSTWLRDWSYDTNNGLQLTLTIPEPSTFGLLAGLGALALAGARRRRKKA